MYDACQFFCGFKKYVDRINTKYAAEICGNHLSYLLYRVSLAVTNITNVYVDQTLCTIHIN